MSFAARVLRDEARRYRELKQAISCPRTLELLDQMAGDLDAKATVIEGARAAKNHRRKSRLARLRCTR